MPSTGNPTRVEPERLPRSLTITAGTLLIGLLILTFWCLTQLPDSVEASSCVQDCVENDAAVAQWEALWTTIKTEGERSLAPGIEDRSLRAAGDTVFMRYRNLWHKVDHSVRQRFQMAALANDPQQKLKLLQPLIETDDPQVRFRALLEIARVQLRLRAFEQVDARARQALAIADIAPRIAADAHFILGYAALEQHDLQRAEEELSKAVAYDPGFWDARQTQLLVLSRQLGRPRQRLADCLNRTRLLIENLGAMPVLAQSRTQFRDIADRFGAQALPANPAFRLLAGLGYLWAGDSGRARAVLSKAKQTHSTLPQQCEALIIARVNELLAQLDR